jgi:hypothetical protein
VKSAAGMDAASIEAHDREMMLRAIALSTQSGEAGEYPYGVVDLPQRRRGRGIDQPGQARL